MARCNAESRGAPVNASRRQEWRLAWPSHDDARQFAEQENWRSLIERRGDAAGGGNKRMRSVNRAERPCRHWTRATPSRRTGAAPCSRAGFLSGQGPDRRRSRASAPAARAFAATRSRIVVPSVGATALGAHLSGRSLMRPSAHEPAQLRPARRYAGASQRPGTETQASTQRRGASDRSSRARSSPTRTRRCSTVAAPRAARSNRVL